MKGKQFKSVLIAVVVAFSIIGSFGIGAVSADTHLPYEDTEIADDTDIIDYHIDMSNDFAAIDDTVSSVDVMVTIEGIEVAEDDTETTTELYSNTHSLGESQSVSNTYNVSEMDRDTYDKFSINIDTVDETEDNFVDDTSVVIEAMGGGGGIVSEDSTLSFLNGNIFGVPVFAWLVLVGIGAFIMYNDKDEF